ncbi:GlxA family transcriptional regulator [Paenirhodobacter enshiensis]|uniref:GlxA family transcriptional regulator n=1 Tax=Paenirhodobacter enshiensis TaxID=1105367 RepID=UPI003FA2C5E9
MRPPRTSAPARPDGKTYVAPGVAHVTLAGQPGCVPGCVQVSFVLMPQFTMLAFTSALEPLRVANQLVGRELFRWNVYSATGTAVPSSNGVAVMPDAALPPEPPEGYILVCGGVEPDRNTGPEIASWLRLAWRRGRTVGGLCTGAYALARAGILSGRKFTLHWENIPGFAETFPDLAPVRQLYCIDGRIVTCAGGVAAADLALKIISDSFGAELGRMTMNMCLLSQRRPADENQIPSIAARLGTRNEKVVAAIRYMEAGLAEGIELDDCAAAVGVTLRQLQRLFRHHLGMTPVQCLNDMRLRRGRALLAETDMPVLEVALACGYASRSSFSKGFSRKFGISPQRFSTFGD